MVPLTGVSKCEDIFAKVFGNWPWDAVTWINLDPVYIEALAAPNVLKITVKIRRWPIKGPKSVLPKSFYY